MALAILLVRARRPRILGRAACQADPPIGLAPLGLYGDAAAGTRTRHEAITVARFKALHRRAGVLEGQPVGIAAHMRDNRPWGQRVHLLSQHVAHGRARLVLDAELDFEGLRAAEELH